MSRPPPDEKTRQKILQLSSQGVNGQTIAARLGKSRSWVNEIIRREKYAKAIANEQQQQQQTDSASEPVQQPDN